MTELRPLANTVAVIDEERCIGCTLCVQACPVDAIVGAAKRMHTVVAAVCTGCELCVPPCPVDCIRINAIPARELEAYALASLQARRRHEARNARLQRALEQDGAKAAPQREESAARRKRETIARAIARARERLENRKS